MLRVPERTLRCALVAALSALLGAGCTPRRAGQSPKVGTVVLLGDSISAGAGGLPSYADGLRRDLATTYGTVGFHNLAAGGATTAALRAQLARVPAPLAGPVFVVVTVGGNDMLHAANSILLGIDEPDRNRMAQDLAATLAELRTPGRFGAGVLVHVLVGNVYDFSDGEGNFRSCGGAMQWLPQRSSDPIFGRWNAELARQIDAAGQHLVDLHALFRGHGRGSQDRWYLDDCIHPNERGHEALRRTLADAIARIVRGGGTPDES